MKQYILTAIGALLLTVGCSRESVFTQADYQAMGSPAHLVIPEGYTSIGERALYFSTDLESVVIPQSVTSIQNWAFSSCRKLEQVTIPASVVSIGARVFQGCNALESCNVKIDANFIVEDGVIYNSAKTNVVCSFPRQIPHKIVLPSTIVQINAEAFAHCLVLDTLVMPQGVRVIGERAFEQCKNLTAISLSAQLESIGKEAFVECYSITQVDISKTVVAIGEGAFSGCSNMHTVTIDAPLKTIPIRCFENCYCLVNISIPQNVTRIEHMAFNRCCSIENISMPQGLISVGDAAFAGCTQLESFSASASLKSLGGGVFMGCPNLSATTLALPKRFEIEDNMLLARGGRSLICFLNTSPDSPMSVTVPEGVTTIERWAFAHCTNLVMLYLPKSLKRIENDILLNCLYLQGIYINKNSPCYAQLRAEYGSLVFDSK